MPKYRNLNLRTFITAINPFLVEEYFVSRAPSDQLIPYLRTMGMNYNYVKDLMADLKDDQLKGKIGEELRQIRSHMVASHNWWKFPSDISYPCSA